MFKYTKNNTTDTCVAIAFARPVEFKNPVKNIKLVLQDLKKANIPVFTIELLFDNQTNVIDNPTKTVYSNSRIVSKENLWNILEKEIPKQYSKIIFLDADIRLTNPDWFNLSSSLLEDNDLIQTHSETYLNLDIDIDYSGKDIQRLIKLSTDKISVAKGLKENLINNNIHEFWVGYSVGITRNFYKKIGGFYDKAILGQGDTLFWQCFASNFALPQQIQQTFTTLKSYKNYYDKNKLHKFKIDYVKDCIACHLFHGIKKKRNYADRCSKQPDEKYVIKNKDSVYELIQDNPISSFNSRLMIQNYMETLNKREEDEECPSYIVSQLIKLAHEQPVLLTENIVKYSDSPDIYQNLYKHHVKCDLCKQEYKQILNEKP